MSFLTFLLFGDKISLEAVVQRVEAKLCRFGVSWPRHRTRDGRWTIRRWQRRYKCHLQSRWKFHVTSKASNRPSEYLKHRHTDALTQAFTLLQCLKDLEDSACTFEHFQGCIVRSLVMLDFEGLLSPRVIPFFPEPRPGLRSKESELDRLELLST